MRSLFVFIFISTTLLAFSAYAEETPTIHEHVGANVDLNVSFVDDQSKAVTLKEIVPANRPVILSLVYYSCPTLCSSHLNGLIGSLKRIDGTAGKDFDVFVISIDPEESPALAHVKKTNALKQYGRSTEGFHFLTGSQASIQQLTQTVGFEYRREGREWLHSSAAIFLNSQGKVARYLHGSYFEPDTLSLALNETSSRLPMLKTYSLASQSYETSWLLYVCLGLCFTVASYSLLQHGVRNVQ